MPFSTYLRDTAPSDVQPNSRQSQLQHHQQHQHQQQHYPTHGGIYSAAYGPGSYYSPSSVPSPSPLNAHNSIPIPGPSSSSSSASASNNAANPSTNVALNKPYSPPSDSSLSSRIGSDGLFQMPSFLMGSFGGTLAPGGGAEVLTPSAFEFFSTAPFTPVPVPPAPSAHEHDSGKPSWQSMKYYTLEEPSRQSNDDVAETASQSAAALITTTATPTTAGAPAPLSASTPSASEEGHVAAPAASPFGYLNAESPRDHHHAPQSDKLDGAAAGTATANVVVPSPVEPSSAMTEPGAFRPPIELYAPIPPSGLPVYSQSGFDMLSILARVARRPNPTITLGPVDLTCAFVVSDVRQADAPIVYASRTFCELTGYSEGEILGRNCRFLQAPGGRVVRNEARRFTSAEAVRELRFALDKDREVQVSLINYRKDGRPFVNRVSIVPIPAEDGASEIAFHVGFQVNLNDQPTLIAQRIQEGKFYSGAPYGDSSYKSQTPAERSARAMGKKLRALLSDSTFQSNVPITTTCNSVSLAAPSSNALSNKSTESSTPVTPNTKPSLSTKPDSRDERQWLNLILLEHMPDFVHVLSLKGHFLYVSPGINRVVGYSPEDLIGKSVGDFCHPSDAVPLLRELKESTGQAIVPNANESQGQSGSGTVTNASGEVAQDSESQAQQSQTGQRIVNLLFRMRTKSGEYAWVESIGRLHVEAGKGRKAIVLSGRLCAMPNLRWGVISQAGGLLGPSPIAFNEGPDSSEAGGGSNRTSPEQEFWAMLCADGLFLVAGMGVRDLLGWGTAEIIGRSVREFILDPSNNSTNTVGGGLNHNLTHSSSAGQVVHALRAAYTGERSTLVLTCQMKKRDGKVAWMQLTMYANESRTASGRIIVQFKLLSASNPAYPTTTLSAVDPYSPTGLINHNPAYPFSFDPMHPHSSYDSYVSGGRPTTTVPPGRILHQPNTNVFAEFETHRGTSWQYELQQLKYANDKLRQEVNTLEARQHRQQQHQQQQHQQHQPQRNQQAVWVSTVRA